ncbi:hypothetical protein AGMMS4952_09040 [Spirochaetia bacterium]|nr:hypothetical protein AGMMS4952_09040 [Spirochaetia bacterium]
MPEKIEIDLYQFIRSELGGLESRIEKRFSESEARTEKRFEESDARADRRFTEFETRTDKRFDEQKFQMNEQFKELKEEVRWPRRIAIAGIITTVLAVGFAIVGFKG